MGVFTFLLSILLFCESLPAHLTENVPDKADSLAFANAQWQMTDLGDGAVAMYSQFQLFQSTQSICVVKYPIGKFKTSILHCPGDSAGRPSEIAKDENAVFAINGGYFHVDKKIPSVFFRDRKRINGYTHPSELFRVNGMLGFKDRRGRRVEMFEAPDTNMYQMMSKGCKQVLASGPLLILDGETRVFVSNQSFCKFYDERHPRAVFGTDDKGYAYLVVIDGRFKGQADGASIFETAYICRMLGMTNAINLDGGGSTTLWTEKTGVINHPYDNRKFDHDGERKVPNLIIVKR